MTFFIDENLGSNVAAGMRAFGEDVRHKLEFPEWGTADVEWLPEIGTRGWILITRDHMIRKRKAELKKYHENNVGGFALGGKSLGRCDLIQQIVRNWPRMKDLATKTDKPFMFRIPPRGTKFDRVL